MTRASRSQAELFPGHNEVRAAAERQARDWSTPAASTPPAPRWMNERDREVSPGRSPALPMCDEGCPWRKPQRVILAERVLDETTRHPWPNQDECQHAAKQVREIEYDEVCWPTLAELHLGPPDPDCAGDGEAEEGLDP